MEAKTCKWCDAEKPLSDFGKSTSKKYKDGYRPYCKTCWRDYQRNYKQENREKLAIRRKELREQNRDKLNEQARALYHKDIAKSRIYQRKSRARNLETARYAVRRWKENNPDQARESYKKWRDGNLEQARGNYLSWAKENKGQIKANSHKRRARKKGNGGSFTEQEWIDLCELFHYRCLCCGEQKPLTVDHVVPIAKGGSNNIENIQPLCMECNQSKHTQIIDYRLSSNHYNHFHALN